MMAISTYLHVSSLIVLVVSFLFRIFSLYLKILLSILVLSRNNNL